MRMQRGISDSPRGITLDDGRNHKGGPSLRAGGLVGSAEGGSGRSAAMAHGQSWSLDQLQAGPSGEGGQAPTRAVVAGLETTCIGA